MLYAVWVSSTVQDRLLQCCASRRTDRHYPETAANSEQSNSDCAPGVSRRSNAKLLLHQLHWLSVQQRITYKLIGSSDVQSSEQVHSDLPTDRRIAGRACSRTLCSSAMRTDFCRRAFRFSAPSVWTNSLPQTVLISDSV